jgi:hypothetical protein
MECFWPPLVNLIEGSLSMKAMFALPIIAAMLINCKASTKTEAEVSTAEKISYPEPASEYLRKHPLDLTATLLRVEDTDHPLYPSVKAVPGCDDRQLSYTLFDNEESKEEVAVFFPSITNPTNENRGDTFILRQSYGFSKMKHSDPIYEFNDKKPLAIRQAKVLMTYNIFAGAKILAEKQIQLNFKTAETMLSCLRNPERDRCAGHLKYLATVRELSKKMYDLRPKPGFMTPIKPKLPSPAGFNPKLNKDPAYELVANYPILGFFPEKEISDTTELTAALANGLEKMMAIMVKKLEEFPSLDYLDMLQFPGSISISLMDQIQRLRKDVSNPNAALIAGSYCRLLSDIYTKKESLDVISSHAEAAALVVLTVVAFPLGGAEILFGLAFQGGSLYMQYARAESAMFRCQTAIGQAKNANQCSPDELQNIAALKPSELTAITTAFAGGIALSQLGSAIGIGIGRTAGTVTRTMAAQNIGHASAAVSCVSNGLGLTAGCDSISTAFSGIGGVICIGQETKSGIAVAKSSVENENIAIVTDGSDDMSIITKENAGRISVVIKKEAYDVEEDDAGRAGPTSISTAGDYDAYLKKVHRHYNDNEKNRRNRRIVAKNLKKLDKKSEADPLEPDEANALIAEFKNATGFKGIVLIEGVHVQKISSVDGVNTTFQLIEDQQESLKEIPGEQHCESFKTNGLKWADLH